MNWAMTCIALRLRSTPLRAVMFWKNKNTMAGITNKIASCRLSAINEARKARESVEDCFSMNAIKNKTNNKCVSGFSKPEAE